MSKIILSMLASALLFAPHAWADQKSAGADGDSKTEKKAWQNKDTKTSKKQYDKNKEKAHQDKYKSEQKDAYKGKDGKESVNKVREQQVEKKAIKEEYRATRTPGQEGLKGSGNTEGKAAKKPWWKFWERSAD